MADRDTAQSLEALLDSGWDYHDTQSERLAGELEAAAQGGVPPDLLAPFLQLSSHVIGEHLGDWPRALGLGQRVLDGQAPTPETARAWGRVAVAATLAGDLVEAAHWELCCLKAAGEGLGAALLDLRFMLVAALVGSQRAREAAGLYRGALDLAGQIRSSPLLDRTIAVASNNLGWELHEMAARSAEEDALMRLCAAAGVEFWSKCGTWINIERAHYLAALVANLLHDPVSALDHTDAALAIIAANDDRPLDGALLELARAVALAALGDAEGRAQAIRAADARAARLTAEDLKAQFAAERARIVG